MATAKKAAAKKAAKRARQAPRKEQYIDRDKVIRSVDEVDEIVSRANEKAPQWGEAWRMNAMGVPSRVIGQKLGVSHTTAIDWANRWEQLVAGDPDRFSDRAHVLAHYDHIIEKQMVELAQLEAAEQRRRRVVEREEQKEGVPPEESAYVPKRVYLEHSGQLLKALGDRQKVVAPHSAGKQVTVELAAAAGASGVLPDALAGVVARVTVTDKDEEAA